MTTIPPESGPGYTQTVELRCEHGEIVLREVIDEEGRGDDQRRFLSFSLG